MARANLTISSELQALFAGALEDKSIRWIQAKVEGEAVVQGEIGKATDSTEADFDGLLYRDVAGRPGVAMAEAEQQIHIRRPRTDTG